MSVNKVNKTTGELVTLANGTRMWIGTQSAHDAAVQAGTMPNNCMVCITDDAIEGIQDITNKVTSVNPIGVDYVKYSRSNSAILLEFALSSQIEITTSQTALFTLPTNVPKPTYNAYIPILATAGSDYCVMCRIDKDSGVVSVSCLNGTPVTARPRGQIMYMIED